jgi:SAM-dependent methyltransferase
LQDPIGTPSDYCDHPVKHDHFREFRDPPDYRAYALKDPYPIPALEDRECYFPDQDYDYWISGLTDFLRIREALEDEGVKISQSFRILDFGCSSGRVLRHFASHTPAAQLYATDVNANHIEWLDRYMREKVTCFQCMNLPTLPLEDNSFDLIYAFSVFTHIDEMEAAWLAELHRVLKKGGCAWFSIQSEDTWRLLEDEGHFMYGHLKYNEANMTGVTITPDLFSNPMPEEKYVFRFNNGVVYNTCVFHQRSYIAREWGKFFDVLKIINCGHDWQDVVLMRKRT